MKGKTAFQKIVDAHLQKILPDGRMVLGLDWVWCHEITTPNAILDAQERGCDVVFNPNKIKAMIDHINPAKDTLSAIQGKIIREWCKKHGIEFLDVGRNGICHAVIPERGWILPGQIGIMGDSHTCTHGAFCSFAAGVGTTDLENGIITGLWVCPPQKVIRINIAGKKPANVFAKDIILALIGKIGVKGATNSVLEFGGPVVKSMSMDARMTLTNMAVEAGATSGMIGVDYILIEYLWPILKKKYATLGGACVELSSWNSEPGCEYSQVIDFDVSSLRPMITQNYSPGDVVPVKKLAGKKVDQVYIGSCTNGRIEDFRIAAGVFADTKKSVAKNIRCIVVPATPQIWRQANREGLLDIFMKAGCLVSNPTCGACLGMSCGVIAPGEVCVSTTNRNFPGRMGKDGMVHLVSPATAAITAIKGVIAEPESEYRFSRDFFFCHIGRLRNSEAHPVYWRKRKIPPVDYSVLASKQSGSVKDFSGKVFYLPSKNVDTDQIIPAKYLTEISKKALGQHCLEDARISQEERRVLFESQIIVADENFGCGSSREHAPWALEATGIRCVIAPSFARIFYENMFNNGLLCIELPKWQIDDFFLKRSSFLKINLDEGLITTERGEVIPFVQPSGYQLDLIRNKGSVGVILKLAAELN